MTNELQTTNAAAAAVASLKAGISNVKRAVPEDVSMHFLKMATDGMWSYGSEDTQVEKGSEWALNPLSLRHGWVAWKRYDEKGDKRPAEKVGEVLVSFSAQPVSKHSLEDLTEHNTDGGTAAWQEAISMTFKCVSGEDVGTEVMYTNNSYGGRKAFGVLVDALQARLDVDPVNFVPIVELTSDSYVHKSYGKTYEAIFSLVDWTSMEGPEQDPAAAQVEQSPEPVRVERAPEPAPVAKAAPQGRRARKAVDMAAVETEVVEEQQAEQPAAVEGRTRTRTRRAR